MIYFDNAATTGHKPFGVIRAVNYALKNYSANPGRGGHKPSVNSSMAVYGVRSKISDFFGGVGAENVAFTANCTHALNFVIKGCVNKNSHVVTSDLEHNAVMRPLKKQTDNISVFAVDMEDDDKTVENFARALKGDTALVICTAASNVIGKILPLKRIGEICKNRNIPFAVDGAQGGGVIPINMAEMNIDYLCLAPHKGLYAPMGSGVLIARRKMDTTVIEGGNGIDSLSLIQKTDLPEGMESGTVGVPAIIGIGAGLDFVKEIGISEIYKKELALIKYLYKGLSNKKKVILYTPPPSDGIFAPVLSFNIKGKNSEEIGQLLDKNHIAVRAGYHCSFAAHNKLKTEDVGTVRVSTSIFNNIGEIRQLLEIIEKV